MSMIGKVILLTKEAGTRIDDPQRSLATFVRLQLLRLWHDMTVECGFLSTRFRRILYFINSHFFMANKFTVVIPVVRFKYFRGVE